jgi:hypothetical protein
MLSSLIPRAPFRKVIFRAGFIARFAMSCVSAAAFMWCVSTSSIASTQSPGLSKPTIGEFGFSEWTSGPFGDESIIKPSGPMGALQKFTRPLWLCISCDCGNLSISTDGWSNGELETWKVEFCCATQFAFCRDRISTVGRVAISGGKCSPRLVGELASDSSSIVDVL